MPDGLKRLRAGHCAVFRRHRSVLCQRDYSNISQRGGCATTVARQLSSAIVDPARSDPTCMPSGGAHKASAASSGFQAAVEHVERIAMVLIGTDPIAFDYETIDSGYPIDEITLYPAQDGHRNPAARGFDDYGSPDGFHDSLDPRRAHRRSRTNGLDRRLDISVAQTVVFR